MRKLLISNTLLPYYRIFTGKSPFTGIMAVCGVKG